MSSPVKQQSCLRVVPPPQWEGTALLWNEQTAQTVPHLGLLPGPCVLCVCCMKYMLEQEGRAFHVPIIYPLFQTDASETFSWHIVGPVSLQSGPGPRFCSLFSAHSARAALPTCPKFTPTKAAVLPLKVACAVTPNIEGSVQNTCTPPHELLRCQVKADTSVLRCWS